MSAATHPSRSFAELTRLVFGRAMSVDQAFAFLEIDQPPSAVVADSAQVGDKRTGIPSERTWVGSIGYERFRVHTEFAAHLAAAGVERLIDVRQLPISRRRGYAKAALSVALAAEGVEYMHMRDLGNPKPTRDLYKAGHTEEGRAGYEAYLLAEQRTALEALAKHLNEKRCALMCVEHDTAVCHRDVIFEALRRDVGLDFDLAEIG